MIGVRKHSRWATLVAASSAVVFCTNRARAELSVSIRVESDAELETARRLTSELSSEGYSVEIRESAEPSPCESGATLAAVPQGTKVWIRLAAGPAGGDTVVASICYLGALPFLQQASVSGPSEKSEELALATAEALNGLRSKLPPAAAIPESRASENDDRSRPAALRVHDASPPGLVNSVALGTALVLNLPDFPAAPGLVGRATLGVVPDLGFAVDAFVPTTGRELASAEVTATVRTTWLRVGPRLRGAAGDFDLSLAALAGPSVTWATGVAHAPRVGTTDVTTGAVLSLAAFAEYPRNAAVFACVSASASALLPGVRVDLGDDDVPQGSWPLEASIGFGVRWGGNR